MKTPAQPCERREVGIVGRRSPLTLPSPHAWAAFLSNGRGARVAGSWAVALAKGGGRAEGLRRFEMRIARDERRCSGITLIECLVYLSMFFVIATLAFGALRKGWSAHRAIQQNAADIAAALSAGELWRTDIRAASGAIRSIEEDGALWVEVPRGDALVVYAFHNGQVWRASNPQAKPVPLLRRVRSSEMKMDRRESVVAWQWELELKPSHAKARLRPLFTFTAVPAASSP